MKSTIITTLLIFSSIALFSQCANSAGNYEFSISNSTDLITIQVRNTRATIRSNYFNPNSNIHFTGLVFGIKWLANSEIVLYKNHSLLPFDVITSSTIKQKNNFNFQSYGDASDKLPLLSNEFMSGAWHTIATIPYSGNLAYGEKFELTECGFDLSTDPYFAQMDMNGKYEQFAPNLQSNQALMSSSESSSAVFVYPNPTMGNLFIDINSTSISNVTFKVMDMTGNNVKEIKSDIQQGLNKIILDVSELPPSMYMLNVVDGKLLNYKQTFSKQ